MKSAITLVLLLSACGGEFAVSPVSSSEFPLTRTCTITHVSVRDFGHVVYEGDVDLSDELGRISRGERLRFPHDGTVFSNREGRLPQHERGFYREYVHRTDGIRGPGPQRVVLGRDCDTEYYTPDHYSTFAPIPRTCAIESKTCSLPIDH